MHHVVGLARPGAGKNVVLALVLLLQPGVHFIVAPLTVLLQEMNEVISRYNRSRSAKAWVWNAALDIMRDLRTM